MASLSSTVAAMTNRTTDTRKTGLAFLAGSLGGLVTMAIHPTGAHTVTPEQFDRLALQSGIAHSLAMVSFLLLFLGAIGLTRRLAAFEAAHSGEDHQDRLALTALVAYGFGVVALLLATAVSGFIIPDILQHSLRDAAANRTQWQIVIDSVFQFNQAFAKIYSVAASAAILLWSASALRNPEESRGGISRAIALYGCVIAPPLVLLIAVGHLRLDVHGMAVVVLAHAIWFVVVGVQLLRDRDTRSNLKIS